MRTSHPPTRQPRSSWPVHDMADYKPSGIDVSANIVKAERQISQRQARKSARDARITHRRYTVLCALVRQRDAGTITESDDELRAMVWGLSNSQLNSAYAACGSNKRKS